MSTRRLALSVPEPATRCPPRCPVEAPSVSPQGYGSSLLPGPPTSVLAAPPPTVRSMVKVWGSCGNVTSLLRTLHLPQNGEVRAAEATARPQSPARGPETPRPPDHVPFAPSAPAAWTVLPFPPQNASSHHSTFLECLSLGRVSVGTRGCHTGWWRGRGCRACVGCQAAPLAYSPDAGGTLSLHDH